MKYKLTSGLTVLSSVEPETSTLAITDVLSCSNFAVHHKYLFKEKQLWTKASGKIYFYLDHPFIAIIIYFLSY